MRAVIFQEFGEPAEVLHVQDVAVPEPRTGEVRVKMLASPLNPSDLMAVRGVYSSPPELPTTPGFEGVGIVEASGGGVLGRFLVGRRVAVLNRSGGNWCAQTVIPAKQAIPLAGDLPLEQAAMFFVNPATAYVMTRVVLDIPPGAWLLQTAAGSALGRMVIRLGQRFGFRTLNVVRREEQAGELKELGGDVVLGYNPERQQAEQLRDEVMHVTAQQGVAFAIDPVGGKTGSAVVGCLAQAGRMLVYGTLSGEPISFSPRELMGHGARIEGFWLARWMETQQLFGKLRLIRNITQLMRAGVLVSEVAEMFPLERVVDAVREAERTGRKGKVLLRMNES